MSVFLERNHLFLRDPHGGVEDVASMKAAGFTAIFCNIKDSSPEEWQIVRERAFAQNVVCGPWARTTQGDSFETELLDFLLETADAWAAPLIVNSEAELKGSGDELTTYITERCGERDWALSMEPWPFANVDWTPIKVPVLPQCFGPDWGRDSDDVRTQWQAYGVSCVVHTFGTYNEWQPDLYRLDSPFGLYTADDCGNQFTRWQATGKVVACTEPSPQPPPTNGGTVPPTGNEIPPIVPGEDIGTEHGITALVDWLQKQPGMPTRSSSYDPKKPGTWPWPERLERTLKQLATDHDNPPTE